MTMITALIIQSRGNDIKCLAGGPDKQHGKYCGWISLYRGSEYDHDLLSSEPVFNTKQEAVKAMEDLVAEVRSMDLSPEANIKRQQQTKMNFISKQ